MGINGTSAVFRLDDEKNGEIVMIDVGNNSNANQGSDSPSGVYHAEYYSNFEIDMENAIIDQPMHE